jgi:hypothetical protein
MFNNFNCWKFAVIPGNVTEIYLLLTHSGQFGLKTIENNNP